MSEVRVWTIQLKSENCLRDNFSLKCVRPISPVLKSKLSVPYKFTISNSFKRILETVLYRVLQHV